MSPPPKPALWVVRHAAPCIAPGTCYGTLDIPAQADATERAVQQLAAAIPQRAAVWHSPLQRCEQLALTLCALRNDLSPNLDARLREMDFGHWEGRLWDDIPRTELDAWTQNFAHYCPGQGEALAHMLERVSAALNDALHTLRSGTDVVWVTHAGVARCVDWLHHQGSLAAALNVTAAQWPQQAPAFGEWDLYAINAQGKLAAPQKA